MDGIYHARDGAAQHPAADVYRAERRPLHLALGSCARRQRNWRHDEDTAVAGLSLPDGAGQSPQEEPELRAFNGAYWLDRLQPPVHTPPERFGPERPFPEHLYLRRHPDVRAGVENGSIPSGFHRYQHRGFAEKRPI